MEAHCLVRKPWCWVWSRSDATSLFLQVGVQPYSFSTGIECRLPSTCPVSLRAHSCCFIPSSVGKHTEITGSYWREEGPKDPDPFFVHHPPPLLKAYVWGDQATIRKESERFSRSALENCNRHSQKLDLMVS